MTEALTDWTLLGCAALTALALMLYWLVEQRRHIARVERVGIRVHVNGIRGKSSITRYVAAALRAADLNVIAKTTGSATRLIAHDGRETPVKRIGAPTILEQIRLLRHAIKPDTDAIVVECMALNPEYQDVSERRMIRATDGVIANIRRDHLEQLGHSLEDIAHSLASTVPQNGTLYTAVDDPALLDILRNHATGPVVTVSGNDVTRDEMDAFGPMDVPENVAIALAISGRYGVPRDTALAAMADATKDPGASALKQLSTPDGTLHWLNLFSVNDVDSVRQVLEQALAQMPDLPVVLMLNTRTDRNARTAEFVDWITQERPDTRVVEMGDAADLAEDRLDAGRARNAGVFHVKASESRHDIVRRLLRIADSDRAIAVGLANIHSDDADILGDRFEDR